MSEPTEQDAKPVPLEDRHPPVGWVIERFQLNLDALREMLDEAVPHIRALDERRLDANALAALKSLSEPRQEQLRAVIAEGMARAAALAQEPATDVVSDRGANQNGQRAGRQTHPANESATDDSGGSLELGSDGVEQVADDKTVGGEGHVASESPPADSLDEGVLFEITAAQIKEIFGSDRHLVGSFLEGVERALLGPSRQVIIHNSLLAMAIGASEVLISGLVTRFYIKHPDALDPGKPEFSLLDLRRFEDVEDAADALIARRVSDLMFGSLDDWAAWFKKNCKAEFEALAMDYGSVREAFQRRHVVMHNGGLVSREYVARVAHSEKPPMIGTRLVVDSEYLHTVLDELEVLGTSVGALAWGTWDKTKRDAAANLLLKRTYQLMLLGRWRAVEGLARLGSRLACSDVLALSLRCNHWLSRAEQGGPDAIRSEVESWDTTALTGRFRLVRLVFLEDFERALAYAEELIDQGEITFGELHEWPILRTLREQQEFGDVSKRLAAAQENGDKPDIDPHGPVTA